MFYFYESPYKDRSTRVCVVRERVNNLRVDQDISWSNHFCPKPQNTCFSPGYTSKIHESSPRLDLID